MVNLPTPVNYQVTAPAGASYSKELPVSMVVRDIQQLALSSGPSEHTLAATITPRVIDVGTSSASSTPPRAPVRPATRNSTYLPAQQRRFPASSTPSTSPVRQADLSLPPHLRYLANTSTTSTPPLRAPARPVGPVLSRAIKDPASEVIGPSIGSSEDESENQFIRDEDGVVDITENINEIGDDAYYSDSEFDQDNNSPSATPYPR